jgi:phage baseplate assembly protein W
MATTVTRKTADFKDLDFNFTRLSTTSDIARKSDVEAVKQSMKSLIQTRYFERPFQPYLGSSIADLLFENNTPMTRRLIEKSIREVIDNHEPRARIEDVQVFDEPDTNTYRVRIFFYVVNFTGSEVFETFLVRTR